jgi:hypothetical protein
MTKCNIDRNRRRLSVAVLTATFLAITSTIASAHGGEEHVIGVVVKISDSSVSVKTKDGKTVEVEFNEKTTYARMKQPVDKTAIKVRDRIVIHAIKNKEMLFAHTVEIGLHTSSAAN